MTTDKFCWCLRGSGKFDTRSFYKEISGANISPFPCLTIWPVKIPKRVAFFVWKIALGRILTLDNLMRRGATISELVLYVSKERGK